MQNWKPYLLLFALTFGLLGCGNNPSSSTTPPPTPSLSSISPNSIATGSSSFTITATGSNFIRPSGGQCGSEICFNHHILPTDFGSSSELRATVPSTLILSPGSLPVFIVSNCEVPSNTLTFTVGGGPCSIGVILRASVSNSGGQSTAAAGDPNISGNGRFVTFESTASDLVSGDTLGFEDIFLRDTCLGVTTSCTPSTIRVSVDSSGAEANGDSNRTGVTDDGRYVVFSSFATNLDSVTADTNGFEDVYLRDTCIGATSCTPSTIRISVDTAGAQAIGGESDHAFISDDGRFVAFRSLAANLVIGDTNSSADIFLRDTCNGATSCTPSTIRVSVDSSGAEAGPPFGADSDEPHISGTGRFIVFHSFADNLVTGDGNFTSDVFLRDTCIGAVSCTPSTIRLSVDSSGTEGNGFSEEAFVSDDGRFASFDSFSTNLVTGDTNASADIFLRDTCIGATSCTPSTTAISVSTGGTLSNADSFSGRISPTGRFVVYDSGADNLVPGDTNASFDIFIRDTCFGATSCSPTTTRLSVDSSGVQANGFNEDPYISDDGRFVAFVSSASNLVSGDTNGTDDIFVAQTCF